MPDVCNICGGKQFEYLFQAMDYISGRNFDVFRCSGCGLGRTHPQPSEQELKVFYPDKYYNEQKTKFNFFIRQVIKFHEWIKIKTIRYYLPNTAGRMLDIGCGRGWQLSYFKKQGWDTYGIEHSEAGAAFAREQLKLNISINAVQNCGFKEGFFDLVSLWHVLEHLSNPKDTLQQIWKITKKDGLLFISVPNFASWQSKIAQDLWFHLDVPRHLYHFTPSSLEELLKSANFTIISKSTASIDYGPFGWIQSALNLVGCEFNFLWGFIMQKSSKIDYLKKPGAIFNLLFSVVLLPFYVLLGALLEFAAVLFSSGAVITVVAKKN